MRTYTHTHYTHTHTHTQMAVHYSDKLPILILSNLANGTYHFTLTITNQNKEKASDNVTLTVLPNPHERHIIQVHVEEDPWNFTQDDLVCGRGKMSCNLIGLFIEYHRLEFFTVNIFSFVQQTREVERATSQKR